jgi:hypothetical protein
MSGVAAALERSRALGDPFTREGSPLRCACRFEPPATEAEIAEAWVVRPPAPELEELVFAELIGDSDLLVLRATRRPSRASSARAR